MGPERSEKYLAQTEELYAAIGRFAVKFEHVVHRMHACVASLLIASGLKNDALANAVLAGLTADPMLTIFRAVVFEYRGDSLDAPDRKILDNVVTRVRKLIESRNDVIHRTWFVGWAAEFDTDFGEVMGWKFKNSGKGVEFRPLHFTRADFDTLSVRADELSAAVGRIDGCLLMGTTFAKNFVVDEQGNAQIPAGG